MRETPPKGPGFLGRLRSFPLWVWVVFLAIESIILLGLVVLFLLLLVR